MFVFTSLFEARSLVAYTSEVSPPDLRLGPDLKASPERRKVEREGPRYHFSTSKVKFIVR